MTTIGELVEAAGGLLHKRSLVFRGATDAHLTLAVRNGEVRRPRRGWYSTFAPDDPRFIAVRVGGRLTGASALRQLGAWMWSTPPITVSVPRNASRLRWRRGVTVVWDSPDVARHGSKWSVGLRDALRQAVLELPFEEAVAVLDWALKTERLLLDEVPDLLAPLPEDVRALADWVCDTCDSFPESIARTRFRMAGHRAESQLPLATGQRVDLRIDGVLGVEVDGKRDHAGAFERDRRKDLQILVERHLPIRMSYTMVRDEWPTIDLAVRTALSLLSGASSAFGNSGPMPRPARRKPRLWRIPARHARTGPELPNGAAGWPAQAGRGRCRRGLARRRTNPLATI